MKLLVKEYEKRISDLEEALMFYADPENYHAIKFIGDPPCGSFIDDFSEVNNYNRPMPGKLARETLTKN